MQDEGILEKVLNSQQPGSQFFSLPRQSQASGPTSGDIADPASSDGSDDGSDDPRAKNGHDLVVYPVGGPN